MGGMEMGREGVWISSGTVHSYTNIPEYYILGKYTLILNNLCRVLQVTYCATSGKKLAQEKLSLRSPLTPLPRGW